MSRKEREVWAYVVAFALAKCARPWPRVPDDEQQEFYWLWLDGLGYRLDLT